MKAVLKYVYYCDFCKKRYMIKTACEKHEKHCTLNQDRECGLCGIAGRGEDAWHPRPNIRKICDKYGKKFILFDRDVYEGVEDLVPIYAEPFTTEDIIDDCEGCPSCTLTVIRCLGLLSWHFLDKFEYDYKKGLEDFWKEIGDREEEEAERDTYY